MELIYLWVGDFRSIKNTEFNLSSDFTISFDVPNNRLSINERESEIPLNFFGPNILNTSAIIGKNGNGKTSFFELLCDFIPNYHTQSIVAFRNPRVKNSIIIFLQNKLNNSIKKVEIENRSSAKITVKRYLNEDPTISGEEDLNAFLESHFYFIFHTQEVNLYDHIGGKHVMRFSPVDALIHADQIYKKLFPNQIISERQGNIGYHKRLNVINDTYQYLHVLENIPSLPEIIFGNNRKRLGLYFDETGYIKSDETVQHWIQFINKTPYFQDICNAYKTPSAQEQGGWIQIRNEPPLISYLFGIALLINERIAPEKLDKNENFLDAIYKALVGTGKEKIADFFKYVRYELSGKNVTVSLKPFMGDYFYMDFLDMQFEVPLEEGKQFLGYYSVMETDKNLIRFHFPLSSGQKAFLSYYARLFYASQKTTDTNKTILLLIDESDAFLHPEWQNKFLNQLLSSLELLFDNKIQVIISSHSPFITSDLPNRNVIYIEGDISNPTPSFYSSEKKTLGGNIYDLLNDSFYLTNGFIGEFASKRIDQVINFLLPEKDKRRKPIDEDFRVTRESARQIIDLIGEDVIKNKLRQMYYLKFGNDTDTQKS